jgi:hypothetical protein
LLAIYELGVLGPSNGFRLALIGLAVTALAVVQPLALPTALASLGAVAVWRALRRRSMAWADYGPAAVAVTCALPWAANALAITRLQPILMVAAPSPPLGEALWWGGLPLLLALAGAWTAARRRADRDVLLLVWLAVSVAASYAPLPVQRRLSLGVWAPLCLVAALGFRDGLWPLVAARWRPALLAFTAAVAPVGNGLVVLAAVGAVLSHRPDLFLSRAEARTVASLPAGALVLAAPETGMFIPDRSDARVIYGHQYETVDAAQQKQAVEDFFAGRTPPGPFLDVRAVDYVFYGPREAALGPPPELPGWRIVFREGAVAVYGR